MGKEILLVVDSISNERGIQKDIVFSAIEAALASVTEKSYPEGALVRVSIDRTTGIYESFRVWCVVHDDLSDSIFSSTHQIRLKEAQLVDPDLVVGDCIEEAVESVVFGRIAAQRARQLIYQKVREAEREKLMVRYKKHIGEIVSGTVKRVTSDYWVLDLGEQLESMLMREQAIPREIFRVNDRVRAYLYDVKQDKRGIPQLCLSRTHPGFLIELFKIEVPEIAEEVIEIKAAARDPGLRAKIAIKTNDGRIDPIGACVGMRGARVQAVSNELNGERIDVILWDDHPAQLVIHAMSPAEVASIVVDEEAHSMDVAVCEEQLSQAIGRHGQNVRLASELTGWVLNVMTESAVQEKYMQEAEQSKKFLIDALHIDESLANTLVSEGFTHLEEILSVSSDELSQVSGLNPEQADGLQRVTSNVLLMQAIVGEEQVDGAEQELLNLSGMSTDLARELAKHGIMTREELAEQSASDLMELIAIEAEEAGRLIMAARSHWFEAEKEER